MNKREVEITDEEWDAHYKKYGLIACDMTEYNELLKASYKLKALQKRGVHKWEGFSDAMKIYEVLLKNNFGE